MCVGLPRLTHTVGTFALPQRWWQVRCRSCGIAASWLVLLFAAHYGTECWEDIRRRHGIGGNFAGAVSARRCVSFSAAHQRWRWHTGAGTRKESKDDALTAPKDEYDLDGMIRYIDTSYLLHPLPPQQLRSITCPQSMRLTFDNRIRSVLWLMKMAIQYRPQRLRTINVPCPECTGWGSLLVNRYLFSVQRANTNTPPQGGIARVDQTLSKWCSPVYGNY